MTTANICRCNHCSGEIEFESSRVGEAVNCPHCEMETMLFLRATPNPPKLPTPEPPPRLLASGETLFYSDDNVQVTNARLIVGGQTYAMRNVTSVRGVEVTPSHVAVYALTLAAGVSALIAAAFLQENWKLPVGWLFIVVAIFFSVFAYFVKNSLRSTFQIWINTAGAEQRAMQSRDANTVSAILDAINRSIVSRG